MTSLGENLYSVFHLVPRPHGTSSMTPKHVNFLQSDVVLKVGSKNPVLETIKALLDRAAPLLVDEQCIKELFKLVKDAVEGLSDEEDDEYEWNERSGVSPVGKKGLALLLVS